MSRTPIILLALAAGVGGTFVLDHLGWISLGEKDVAVPRTSPRTRPRPAPSGGGSMASTPSNPGTVGVADELGSPAELVPENAFLYLEVASISTVEGLVRNVLARVQPSAAGSMSADMLVGQMLMMVGGDPEQLDRRRPFGVALSMPSGGMGQPAPTLILPVKDPPAFARSLRLPPGFADAVVRPHYVGVTMGSNYEVGSKAPSLARNLPDGAFAMRMRMDPIRPMMAPAMQAARAQAGQAARAAGVDSKAYMAGVEFGLELLESLEQVEAGIDAGGKQLRVHYALKVAPDSTLALPAAEGRGRLHELAGYVDPEDSVAVVFAWDQAFLDDVVAPLLEVLGGMAPTETDKAGVEALQQVLTMVPIFGEEVVFSGRFELGGSRGSIYCRPANPDAFVESFPLALAGLDLEGKGVVASPLEREDVQGKRVYHMTLGLDETHSDPQMGRIREAIELCFGSSRVDVRLASKDGHLGLFLGGGAEWQAAQLERLGAPGDPSMDVAEAFERVSGDSPCVVYRIDMLGLMSSTMSLMAEQMGLDPTRELEQVMRVVGEEPLHITVYGGVDGTRWQAGFRMDWDRFYQLMEAFF